MNKQPFGSMLKPPQSRMVQPNERDDEPTDDHDGAVGVGLWGTLLRDANPLE
jgi:hypothetical protein